VLTRGNKKQAIEKLRPYGPVWVAGTPKQNRVHNVTFFNLLLMNTTFFRLFFLFFIATSCQKNMPTNYDSFDHYPFYPETDLGLTYLPTHSTFKIWAPTASEAQLRLYEKGIGGTAIQTLDMKKGKQGTWEAHLDGDQQLKYYTFQVKIDDEWMEEVPDPYAKAVGVNGRRAMVVDLSETDPEGWENDIRPPLNGYEDIIIYELHIRDLSISDDSGIEQKGKFLGLTETGTVNPDGLSTGIDHIKSMGVTHVHLLPAFDFRSIDEARLEENKYNWGYDPLNYNVPEGSYSTDPYDGRVRIREFKAMVRALHDAGLRVILDVVYNHTGYTKESNFNQLVPGYYYRQDSLGHFANGSACGNETASERPMMRKFMIESVRHWIEEYHLDGFRFDLMALHDIETMNQISKMARQIDPTIFIYGEGWQAGGSPLAADQQATKFHAARLDHIAVFSDDIRDAIKGHVFSPRQGGFVSGRKGLQESIKFGIVAATEHPQIAYSKVNYSGAPYADHPLKTITYVSCHDNNTLWDKIKLSRPEASQSDRIKMAKLGLTIVLTSQGVPFLHAGSEFLRTKNGVENSFESPDSINQMDWARKTAYQEVVAYVQALIRLRKAHPAFRMKDATSLQQHLTFLETQDELLVAYRLSDHANGDDWQDILLAFNGAEVAQTLSLPEGTWRWVLDGEKVSETPAPPIISNQIKVPAYGAIILAK
jgi:pullulanase